MFKRKTTSPKDMFFYEFRRPQDTDLEAVFNYDINEETAKRLAERFNTTPEFWLNLQKMHNET